MNTTIGQINMLPFQNGASSLNALQTGEDNGFPNGPFTTILEKMIQASGCHANPGQTDGQPALAFKGLSLWRIEAALLNGAQNQRTSEAGKNRILAILQQIAESNGGRIDREQFAEQFFHALGMTGDTALARLMQSQNPAVNEKREMGSAGENITPDMGAEQDGSLEAMAEEILALLAPLDGSAGRQIVPSLQPGKVRASEGDDPENMSAAQNDGTESKSARYLLTPAGTEEIGDSFRDGEGSLDGEERNQPTDTDQPAKAPPETLPSGMQGASLASSLEAGNQAANGAGRSEETKDSGRKGLIEPATRQGDVTETNTAIGKQEPGRNGHTTGTAKTDTYKDIQRAASETIEEPTDKPSSGAAAGQNAARNSYGEVNDAGRHREVVFSRFYTDKSENHQATPSVEQAIFRDAEGVMGKTTDKTESLFNKIEPEVAKVDNFGKSHSFSKGEGDSDSHQLGQGQGSQGATQGVAAEKAESASSFGNIVAERIARTVEHIAQSNRTDLTLRLKIDGSESVLLEMKERAGTITIGIQCQDKALVKALESQKEMMIRNLETKNLNTSISITSVGEDESDGQRQWRRERQEQRRDNWNGRQTNSRAYFETLI